jgi:Pyridoxamine 5'-phosphate oxidase
MSTHSAGRRSDMTAPAPRAKNLADLYHLAPLEWSDVSQVLDNKPSQEPGTGGPDHHTFWLSTIDTDGRPHMTAVGAFWVDGRYYFCGNQRSRKIRNVERDPRCAFGVAMRGYDVALEGHAVRVRDEELLRRLAEVFAQGGWAPTVAEGGFTHEFSAPSAGPPPWYVYEFTPEDAYAVATKEPGGATRWTF